MRYRKAIDANQKDIVAYLRARELEVLDIHKAGYGIPDIAVRLSAGFPVQWQEVKMPGSALTPAERDMRAWWPGYIPVVHTGEESYYEYVAFLKRLVTFGRVQRDILPLQITREWDRIRALIKGL